MYCQKLTPQATQVRRILQRKLYCSCGPLMNLRADDHGSLGKGKLLTSERRCTTREATEQLLWYPAGYLQLNDLEQAYPLQMGTIENAHNHCSEGNFDKNHQEILGINFKKKNSLQARNLQISAGVGHTKELGESESMECEYKRRASTGRREYVRAFVCLISEFNSSSIQSKGNKLTAAYIKLDRYKP